jgi:hypothetical protein
VGRVASVRKTRHRDSDPLLKTEKPIAYTFLVSETVGLRPYTYWMGYRMVSCNPGIEEGMSLRSRALSSQDLYGTAYSTRGKKQQG